MSKQKAHINPSMLTWVRTTLKADIVFAADKIGVTAETLSSWERGVDKPSIPQLLNVAKAYNRPFTLFFLPAPPRHFKPLQDFRKFPKSGKNDQDEYQLQKELLIAQQNRMNALYLMDLLGEQPVLFPIKLTVDTDPEKAAKLITTSLGIRHSEVFQLTQGYETLSYWKRFFEERDILVYQTTGVDVEVMRGACVAESVLPVVIVNSNDTENGRVFSLFHELVHIALREDGISNFRYNRKDLYDQIETYCNRVAAEILVPSEHLLEHSLVVGHGQDMIWQDRELKQLSNHFCVSQEVILRRLLTLKRTDNTFYEHFRASYIPKAKTDSSGGNYYRNVVSKTGRLIINLALQGYYQQKITTSELYDYIQVKPVNIPKLEKVIYAKV